MGSGALLPEEITASEAAPDGLGEALYLVVREDTANEAGWALLATAQSWKLKHWHNPARAILGQK